jgi:pyruvate dehydrogenase E2 component (dihydrolipoamide acetyltransferase)
MAIDQVGEDAQHHETTPRTAVTANREVPHFYAERQINLTSAVSSLQELNADLDPDDSNDLSVAVLWAIIKALRDEPNLNGHLTGGEYLPSQAVHLGLTVASSGDTLIAPTLQDADRMTVQQLSHQLRDLTRRARSGLLRQDHEHPATITVDRLGLHGADLLYGIVNPPQVALVCMGRVVDRPWVVDGEIEACKSLTVSLAGDNRVSDGRDGSRFLEGVDLILQEPIGVG